MAAWMVYATAMGALIAAAAWLVERVLMPYGKPGL